MRKPAKTAADFHGLSWVFARPANAIAVLLGVPLVGLACWSVGGLGRTICYLVCALGLGVFVLPTRIHVGTEGVALRWLWVKRLLDYRDIESVNSYDERQWGRWREIGLRIELRSGVLYLPMRLHDRMVSLLTPDPMRATEAALTSILFHKDSAAAAAAAPGLGAHAASDGDEDELPPSRNP